MAVTEDGEEIIETPTGDDDTEVLYTDEEIEMFSKLDIDPRTANTDDLKALAKRVIRAENRVIADKKVDKTQTTGSLDDNRVRAILAESRFYDKNPDAEQYKDKIETLVKSNKLSREDALFLASKDDREVDENREVYAKTTVAGKGSGGDSDSGIISIDKYDALSISKQNEYIDKMKAKHGSVKFK